MITLLNLLILTSTLHGGIGPNSWPGSMINSLRVPPSSIQSNHKLLKCRVPNLTMRAGNKKVGKTDLKENATLGVSARTANPIPIDMSPTADDIAAMNDYKFAIKAKKFGDIAKAARIMQHTVDQYPEAVPVMSATMDLADLYFRLGQDKAAYGLMSSYNARWRNRGGDAARLNITDCLLLTSLAVAIHGQVFAGQADYLRKLIDTGSQLKQDLPQTNSVRDTTLLSYLALGWYWDAYKGTGEGKNYRGGGFWYYHEAYKEFGPSAYLDFIMAGHAWGQKDATLAFQYLDDAEARCNSVFLYREIEGARDQFNQEIRDAKNKSQH